MRYTLSALVSILMSCLLFPHMLDGSQPNVALAGPAATDEVERPLLEESCLSEGDDRLIDESSISTDFSDKKRGALHSRSSTRMPLITRMRLSAQRFRERQDSAMLPASDGKEPKKNRQTKKKTRVPKTFFTEACGGLRTMASVEGQAAMCNTSPERLLMAHSMDRTMIEQIEQQDANLLAILKKAVADHGWQVERRRHEGTRQWVIIMGDETVWSAKAFRNEFGEEDPQRRGRKIALPCEIDETESAYEEFITMIEEELSIRDDKETSTQE